MDFRMITRLADVFPAHRKRVTLMVISLQSVLLIVLGVLLTVMGFDWVVTVVYLLLPVAVLQIFAFILIGNYALEPLDYLSRTVTQLSDQPHDTSPPNLNGTRHERTGFKLMIDTIYDRTINGSKITSEVAGQSMHTQLLDSLPGGFIALSEKREISYANDRAPVVTDTNNTKSIQLDFASGDTLDSWLDVVEVSQLRAQKMWMRVQTGPPGSDNRRVFDVVANYEKNAVEGADTLILLFDQTARYAVNENALDFMALAAHELRGPITVIRGYLDILRPELGTLTPDQNQLFDRLEVSSSRLSGYISNILNAAKFDRRHLKLHLREDRVADVLALVSDDLALRASTQGRLLSYAIPADLPTIAADRNSLSEVVANLVDNGIKYSNEGGQVLVTGAVDGDSVIISVQDTGIGIPSSVVSNLFTKFYRSHRSKHTVAGTGLGLYISKAIVESHGGTMSVISTEGQGSTFSFSIPIYASVKDKLLAGGDENQGIIETSSGWIKNHSMYRG